ncbi:MAG: nuclear transport factor 2 family protein [Candidatus Acidiferrales bacterium]
MKKIVAGVTVVLFLALLGYSAMARAGAANSGTQARPEDRAQIEKLMWNYVRALDTFNADAYAATYTPDGQFGTGKSAVKGRTALKKMISDLKKRGDEAAAKGQTRQPMYHMLMNGYVLFPDADHAHMEAYWQTVFGQVGKNVPVRVADAGREVDELVRVNGRWLIKLRDVTPKDDGK